LILRRHSWAVLFGAVAVLLLAQVAWWVTIFLRDVSTIEGLKLQIRSLAEAHGRPTLSETAAEIHSLAHRSRVMFVSETAFFAVLTGVGFWLMLRAMYRERRSREIQRNFLEIMAHESRTPLTALKLRLESVVSKADAEGIGRDLGLALEEVRRLASVFERTMSLNRFERHELSVEEVSLPDLARGVIRRLDPFLRFRGARVELCLPDGDLTVVGDAYAIQTIVQTLIENAVLYNDRPEREVSLAIARRGSRAELSVRDNGLGIPESERARLFERFFRGEAGRRVPGTGLGLFIANSLARAHRGSLALAESRPGAGSLFVLELPSRSQVPA